MRKLTIIILLAALSLTAFAQDSSEGMLKFLGIPIDGPKTQLVEKIKAKGFRYNSYKDCLTGQFNGRDVDVYVVDNHNKAYRVFVAFPYTTEYDIRSDFNHLLAQFLRNDKYVPVDDYKMIDQKEDISYEMLVNNRRYSASFAFISPDVYTPEQRRLIGDLVKNHDTMSEDDIKRTQELFTLSFNSELDPNASLNDYLSQLSRIMSIFCGNVWFSILNESTRYRIGLYYDNLLNMPQGEDL